jgi:hypothetical protein
MPDGSSPQKDCTLASEPQSFRVSESSHQQCVFWVHLLFTPKRSTSSGHLKCLFNSGAPQNCRRQGSPCSSAVSTSMPTCTLMLQLRRQYETICAFNSDTIDTLTSNQVEAHMRSRCSQIEVCSIDISISMIHMLHVLCQAQVETVRKQEALQRYKSPDSTCLGVINYCGPKSRPL